MYIHNYNTKKSPRYAFTAAVLQYNEISKTFQATSEFINHVVHPTTGSVCSCRRLVSGTVPGQSVKVWEKGLANNVEDQQMD